MRLVDDPHELAELFNQDRETHIYGLADLEEPYWSNSTWYRDGDAVVGAISDGSDWVTGYAMSQTQPAESTALLSQIEARLPKHTWVTGPARMSSVLAPVRRLRSVGAHVRMILQQGSTSESDSEVVVLGPADLDWVEALVASSPDEAFFLPSMLEENPFVGIYDDRGLVAMAGTHVVSDAHGVAAIGSVLTHPQHRGRGLGRRVVAAISRLAEERFRTVGLNVAKDNAPAIAIYEQLGYATAFEYEEIELL